MSGEDPPEDPDEVDDDDLEEDAEDAAESVTIEISGLSLYTHHGVSDAEREVGQRLVIDMRLDVGETDATVTDSIEDTVDYAEVCQLVALVAQQPSHKTLERRLRARGRMGQGEQAGAADRAQRRRGLGRGLARSERLTRPSRRDARAATVCASEGQTRTRGR